MAEAQNIHANDDLFRPETLRTGVTIPTLAVIHKASGREMTIYERDFDSKEFKRADDVDEVDVDEAPKKRKK